MSFLNKSYGLALLVSLSVSACNTTSVDTPQQTTLNEQAALEMIASTINSECSAQGFAAGSTEHAKCFWQHASELREQLQVAEGYERQTLAQMNSAAVIADRKFRAIDNYDARRAQNERRNDHREE